MRGASARRAHPRLRGEHFQFLRVVVEPVGSSPLTRGARKSRPSSPGSSRLIPAYAGSTMSTRRFQPGKGAHPRLRGEHVGRVFFEWFEEGSSPLTRGAPSHRMGGERCSRLIPAYAGSTWRDLVGNNSSTAHPRLRGEHSPLCEWDGTFSGSSPLTRGARHCPELLRGHFRLIPAYAGSTFLKLVRRDLWGGSSPLTRGAPDYYDSETVVTRLIPAYAGSTYSPHWLGIRGKAHPRLRGEH